MSFQPLLYELKKDRKYGLILDSPLINWYMLSEKEQSIQWNHCCSVLWFLEKESHISKEYILDNFYEALETLSYTKSQVKFIKKLKDYQLSYHIVSIGYLIQSGIQYEPGIKFFKSRIDELLRIVNEKETITPIRKSTNTLVTKIIGEIQDLEDNILTSNENIALWISSKNLTKEEANKVALPFRYKFLEMYELYGGENEQLNEGYKRYTKDQVKRILQWYNILIRTLDNIKTVKVEKKEVIVKRERPKTSKHIAKKVQYLKRYEEANLLSVSPEKLIGAREVWVYNTSTHRLGCYYSKGTKKISVAGTTLLNYDKTLSLCKKLKNPIIQLKELMSGSKSTMIAYYNSIQVSEESLNGRLNKNTIFLKVF